MKLYSINLELRAIRSIAVGINNSENLDTTPKALVAAFLLSKLSESYFHYEPCKAAYNRVVSIASKRSRILSYSDLVEDPTLDEEFRDILKENIKKPIKDIEQAKNLYESLDSYRKTRELYSMSKTILDKLKEPKIDVSDLLNKVTNSVSSIRIDDHEDVIFNLGKECNASDLIDKALSTEDDVLLKTGFKEFDDRNGGLPAEGVFLIAATTSGGKSALRMQLMLNLYLYSHLDVCSVSLEMNEKKEVRRLLSNLTGIEYAKFVQKRLSEEERSRCKKIWRKFIKFGAKHSCRYSLWCPTRGITSDQLFMLVKPYKFKVVAIDYPGLLEGMTDRDQWKAMSEVVRQAKIFSADNHCLVILLAQLDSEDDRIRYSKGMNEHTDASWIWNYSKQEQRDMHLLPIRQLKARDQELFPFDLKEEFHIMRVSNATESTEVEDEQDLEDHTEVEYEVS